MDVPIRQAKKRNAEILRRLNLPAVGSIMILTVVGFLDEARKGEARYTGPGGVERHFGTLSLGIYRYTEHCLVGI